ncbi:MAG: hypothetical protein AAFR59_05710, partial [Bacteroidota bacterium]
MRYIITLSLLLISLSSWTQKILKPAQLQTDFDYLVTELKAQHQGLYQYLDTTTVDQKLDSLRQSLLSPMDPLAFYQVVLQTIGLTNEGHTSADLPKGLERKIGLSKTFLPIALAYREGYFLITQHFGEAAEGLSKGDRLLRINGQSMDDILTRLFPLIPTDGFNQSSRYEWIAGLNFSLLYRLVWGQTSQFELEVQSFGETQTKKINVAPIRFTAFKAKNRTFPSKSFAYFRFGFRPINDSVAYLCIPSFGEDKLDYEAYYRKVFL